MELAELKTKKGRIGLGIITCDDEVAYKNILDTLPISEVDRVFVYDLSKNHRYVKHRKGIKPLKDRKQTDTPVIARNRLVEALLEDGCEHIFLMTDLVKFKKESGVFKSYIDTAEHYNIKGGLSFAWLYENLNASNMPILKNYIEHEGVGLAFTHHKNSDFEYYHCDVFKKIGLFEDGYHNGFESLDMYKRMSERVMTSMWWWFIDIADSMKYLEQNTSFDRLGNIGVASLSTQDGLQKSVLLFKAKHNVDPFVVPHPDEPTILERIKIMYGGKDQSNSSSGK